MVLLLLHGNSMGFDVRRRLESLVQEGFALKPGNRAPDYQFHGYNDNMPAKAAMGLILGGEMFDDASAIEHGLWSLHQLAAQLSRRGINSEFNSPTYTPLTLHAIGEIADHARNHEARTLALNIEARLWIDIASRFHPEMGVLSGPHARAYTVDSLGHVTGMATLLWFILGDVARPSPMELFDHRSDLVFHHCGNRPFNIAQMCWLAAGSYHLPKLALRLFTHQIYPARSMATAEMGDAGPDFPARPVRIETNKRRDFTLGTSSTGFLSGEQASPYFVTYKLRKQIRSIRDVGTIFTKMVINDDVPGTVNFENPAYTNKGEADLLASRAGTVAIQSDTTAFVITHPHLSLGGSEDAASSVARLRTDENGLPTKITRLSEMILFPSHFGGAEEIFIEGKKRITWEGCVSRGQWIACRRGRLLLAIRPLVYSRTLGDPEIRLEKMNNYEVIRSTFYQGEARTISRNELRHVFGGFVAEHASVDDYSSLAEFVAELASARFTDYFWTTRRFHYFRPQGKKLPGLEVELSCSPGSSQARFMCINRQLIESPALEIDGVDQDEIPMLGIRPRATPEYFPWQDLSCVQADWPWAIGDRGLSPGGFDAIHINNSSPIL